MPHQTLYKFRSWSDPIHKRWLTERQVYFASPAQFNDPFDCAINYRYDLLSNEEKFEKYISFLKKEKSQLSEEELKEEAKKWMSERLLEKEALLENNKKIIRDMVYTKVGVLSLTKTKKPVLLWSHYSDNHKGFCIGYNREILIQDFMKKYNDYKKMVFYEIDIKYSETYPIIIPKKDITPTEYISKPLSTKAKFWEYENEKRILLLGGSREITTVPAEAISEVIMGCKMPDRDQIKIGEYVIKNLSQVSLMLCKMHEEKFELIFQKIN